MVPQCLHNGHTSSQAALAQPLAARRVTTRRAGPGQRARAVRVVAFREDKDPGPGTLSAQQQELQRQMQLLSPKRSGMAVMAPKQKLQPFSYEVPGPLGDQEIDIRVTHNGLCHSDVHMRDNDWGYSAFPFIPGHEVVGEVAAVGSGVKALRPGMRVGVGWIKDSCRACMACLRGEENICERGYTGTIVMGAHGGFQDVMRVPADFAYPIPEGLGSAEAAPLLCAGATVYAPLRAHIKRPGARVAVLGVGGLGHLALQFAAAMGAQVTAIDISPGKEAEARSLGATRFITWEAAERVAAAAQDQAKAQPEAAASTARPCMEHTAYFDVLLNCASANIDTQRLMNMLKPGGTLVQVGIPGGGAMMHVPLLNLVTGQRKVAGTIVAGRADMTEMFQLAADKGIKPMIEIMPLSKVNEAIDRMLRGEVRYRVVLTME